MSMVVFPFKREDPDVATGNLAVAARHSRVGHVVAVGAEADATFDALATAAADIARETGTRVEVVVQDRIGSRRPGKGDGMNTAMRLFVGTAEQRLHFYDADITNFDASWIDGAEEAADAGYPVVRHYFPRASTDAMITWMVTRPVLALTHPDSLLWKIRQPLGGELLVTRPVVETLVADDRVAAQSDWGIDTVLTFATAAGSDVVYEHYVPGGKQHALYGSLADIREMVVECFEAVVGLADLPSPDARHVVEPDAPVGDDLAAKVGYDVEATLGLLTAPWSEAEADAAARLPTPLAAGVLANAERATFSFMTAETWGDALVFLLDAYRPDPGWRDLLFRLWVARVLAYTTTSALGGHRRAMASLEDAVRGYAGAG